MNKTFLKLSAFLMLICSLTVFAQGVKSQSEIIRNEFKPGDYKVIAGYMKGEVMKVDAINLDKSQPKDHFEIILRRTPNDASESRRNAKIKFYADKPYFAMNYMSSGYEGNNEYKKKYGYIVRRGSYAGRYRLVFYNNKVFFLSSWKNKDNYELDDVLVPLGTEVKNNSKKKKGKKRKGKLGMFFKALKEELTTTASSSNNRGMGNISEYKKELQSYLDAAAAKQDGLANSDKAKKLEKKAKDFKKKTHSFVNEYNNFTAINDTGRTVYLYDGSSTKATRYKAGATIINLRCSDQLWFDFTGKRYYYPNNVILFHKYAGPKCDKGSPVKLSQFE